MLGDISIRDWRVERAFTLKSIFKILAVAVAILPPLLAGAQTGAQFALSERELGYWLSAMQRIGTANLADAPSDPLAQTDPATLDDICSQAGFVSAQSCNCTVFYVALLLNGFDSDKKTFVDPAQAVEDRLAKTTQPASANDAARVARDRRMLLVLRGVLPHGAPPEHLALLDQFVRTHIGSDAEPWRELGAGVKSMAARALGARCLEGNASGRQ
jgi:hypothetical protein